MNGKQLISRINELHDKWELALIDSSGEVTEEVEDIEKMIAELDGAVSDKVEAYQYVLEKNAELESALNGVVETLQKRLQIYSNAVKKIQSKSEYITYLATEVVRAHVERTQEDHVLANGRKVKLQKYFSLVKPDEDKLKELYEDKVPHISMEQKYKADATAIKKIILENPYEGNIFTENGFYLSESIKIRNLI